MPCEHIITSVSEGVLRVEIRLPDKKNALTLPMYTALREALETADQRPEVRVVLLHGQPDMFCSGNDVADFLGASTLGVDHPAYAFLRKISVFEKPLVAAVTGPCIGVGATMLLHCDLVYAAQSAVFAMPFVNLGLCPEAGASLLLPLIAGRARAAEILMLGEPFGASRAAECGLLTGVLPDAEVIAHANVQALKLATKPPAALRLTKLLMRRGDTKATVARIDEEIVHFKQRLESLEAKEAFAAFLEKRKPDFAKFA